MTKEEEELFEEELALLEQEEEVEEDSSDFYLQMLIMAMLTIMVIIYFASSLFVVIPAGHKGVLYSTLGGGTQLDEYYDEGFFLMYPWDEMILYNTRIREHQDTIMALTEDGLEVSIEISYRYFPDYTRIGRLHRELGPEYLHTILDPHITAITRDIVSHHRVDKLYSTARDSIQITMTQRSQSQITDNYPISIVDIVVRNIVLPESVNKSIQKKLIREQEMLEYDFKLEIEEKEAHRKIIEAEGEEKARLVEARGVKLFRDTSGLDILKWEGINATKELAKSPNAKVIVVGTGDGDLPIILGGNN